jgi:alcohol dehydrogenase YqhD (iron-dependent ADH family)
MNNFDLYTPTRVLFGKGYEHQIGELLKPYAKKVLLHYGGGSIKKSGLYDSVVASLNKAGLAFVELGGVQPTPRLKLAQQGIELCKKEGVDLILAVGGGSSIDSSKCIAMGYYYDGDIWDVYEKNLDVEKALPVATILTIPAAGSEMSDSTVITNEEKPLKYGHSSVLVRPLLSVMNPEFFFTLPPIQLASGVADMMSHIFERYFTKTKNTQLTDGLCEATLKTIMRNAPLALENMQNYEAWSEIGFAGSVAHNNLLGVGRDQDWACHDMEHELSAIYDVTHGAGLAVLTPAWMKYVYKEDPDMFVQFAVKVMGVDGDFRDKDSIILEGIRRLAEFFKNMGLPTTLKDLGIDGSKLELMAKKCTRAEFGKEYPIGGFKQLKWQDVLAIYKMAQ